MSDTSRLLFHLAALGSVAASLAHVWAILAGPEAYANLGAPPDIVASAEAGTLYAPMTTLIIATVIFGWAIYAWSALQILPRMPLLRTGLIAIAAVLILRGLMLLPALFIVFEDLRPFDYWSSVICFGLGLLYALGLRANWHLLGKQS
ncbi:MAG: hypothetical protein AAFY34_05735 [Pseudomonadota bacterium]